MEDQKTYLFMELAIIIKKIQYTKTFKRQKFNK